MLTRAAKMKELIHKEMTISDIFSKFPQKGQRLAQTMTRLVGIQEEIIEAYKSVQQAQTVNVEMDGGDFSDKK